MPALAGQLLIYPVTDHDFATGSYTQVGSLNWLLSTADMTWFWDHYCPEGIDRTRPEVSPLRIKNARGLAPAMVIVGEYDPLRDEGLAYAAKLARHGVAVSMRCDSRMLHGYFSASWAIPAAAEALSDTLHWMATRFDAAKP